MFLKKPLRIRVIPFYKKCLNNKLNNGRKKYAPPKVSNFWGAYQISHPLFFCSAFIYVKSVAAGG